jgi:hypothetical protein
VEFSVPLVSDVDWNDELFQQLSLSDDKKKIISSLIRAFKMESEEIGEPFDDFVKGKGRGLVINLYGLAYVFHSC